MAYFKIKIPQAYMDEIYSNSIVYKVNEYFKVVIDGCLKHSGIIDKTSNNIIQCYWIGNNHALDALKATIEINDILKTKQDNIKVSCGIATDKSIFAILGSHNFSNYTVLGNVTEVAIRLENACIFHNSSILVSNNTYKLLKDKIMFKHKGMANINGFKSQVDFYEPIHFINNKKEYHND